MVYDSSERINEKYNRTNKIYTKNFYYFQQICTFKFSMTDRGLSCGDKSSPKCKRRNQAIYNHRILAFLKNEHPRSRIVRKHKVHRCLSKLRLH